MSTSVILFIVGAVIFAIGIAKLGRKQSGGISLGNFGINLGGSNTQSNKTGNIAPEATQPTKQASPNWIGLAIAVLGLLTALVGWLKS